MPSAAGMYFSMNDGVQKEQPAVVLLHGAGSSQAIWPAAIRRLAGQRVFAVDLPGHGRSPGVGLQSIAAYADHLVEFLASLGLYQAVFVGHGMGGAIACDLAVRHSAHVAGLGMIASGAYLGVPPDMMDAFSNPLTLSHAMHLFQQRAFGPQAQAGHIKQCLQIFKETRPSVLATDWQACAAFDCRPAVQHINVPGWIMVGSEDQLTPVVYSHFMAGQMPAARLQILPGASHMLILEQPERVAQGLQQFLTALASARMAGARMAPAQPPVEVPASTRKTEK